MHRVPVYLAVEANDSVTRALLPNVSVFTQTVALRVRALLGQQSNELPQGEPAITWQDASSGATITAYRNARLAWAAADSEWSPAYALLDRALQSMRGKAARGFSGPTAPWIRWYST